MSPSWYFSGVVRIAGGNIRSELFSVSASNPGYLDDNSVYNTNGAVRPVISLDISKLIDDSIVEWA